jgi:hypothetical protein
VITSFSVFFAHGFGTKKAHGTIPWAQMFQEGVTKRQLRVGEAQVHAALLV